MIQLAPQAPSPKEHNHALEGKHIVLTRAPGQNDPLRFRLEALGASVLELPLIEVLSEHDIQTREDVFAELPGYEWIVFTSVNGVGHFFDLFFNKFKDIRCLGGMRVACVGKTTAEAVKQYHLQVDLIPEKAHAEALLDALIETGSLDSAKVLVVTGNRNRDTLVKGLEEKGNAIVDAFAVYRTDMSDLSSPPFKGFAKIFREGGADYIVFTSPSTVLSFKKQAKHLQLDPRASHPKAVSIGPITSDAMKAAGVPVALEATSQNVEGIVAALLSQVD